MKIENENGFEILNAMQAIITIIIGIALFFILNETETNLHVYLRNQFVYTGLIILGIIGRGCYILIQEILDEERKSINTQKRN
jgi:hypothetical protein